MSLVVPVGPYHPAIHEPELFRFTVEGEEIVDVDVVVGYVYRGIEKIAEGRPIDKVIFLAERICGICCEAHMNCFAQACENIAKIEVPDRARYIRTMVQEIERIHSHLLLLGVACHELGFDTLFMHTWGIRENIMEVAEILTGNRKTYSMITLGGVRRDITPDLVEKVIPRLKKIKEFLPYLRDTFESSRTIAIRTNGKGIIKYHDAYHLGLVGPFARGSGVNNDIRARDPYAAYKDLGVDVKLMSEGDSWARYMVRIMELEESIDLIMRALDALPGGPISDNFPQGPIDGETLARVEAQRGEDMHYLKIVNSRNPYRWRVRVPTYANLAAAKLLFVGSTIADIPVNLGSMDPCFGCTDRFTTIDNRSSIVKIYTRDELLRRGKNDL